MLISSMKMVICLAYGGAKSLPILKSHSISTLVWKVRGLVADEKFIRLKSMTSRLNFSEYMRMEEVLAVPDTPTYMTALLQILVLGYFRMQSSKMLALKESKVGIRVWEN